jgi:N-acetylglucosamine kinase-like BadF-type ATPase
MTTQQLLLGVDSGGSKTRVVLAEVAMESAMDELPNVLGEGLSGCSNYQYVGEARAVAEIDAGIAAAFDRAGIVRRTADYGCFGIGGADTPQELAKAASWVSDHRWAVHCLTVNDGMLPLYAACPDGQGISLIAGTGAIVWGRILDGRVARSTGWGYLFGDEGGGWHLGHEALRHVARAADGRGPATALTARVLAHWQFTQVYDLIPHLYQANFEPSDIAALARLVLECAAEDDAVALQIARAGAEELAVAVRAVIQTLHMALPLTLAYAGSVLIKSALYRELFAEACRRLVGDLNLVPVDNPVMGAVAAARLLMVQHERR